MIAENSSEEKKKYNEIIFPTWFEGALQILLIIMLILGISFSFLSVFLITLGFDEAWTLDGIAGFIRNPIEERFTPAVLTSGGFYALTNGILQLFVGSSLWAHRLLSWFCMVGICIFLNKRIKTEGMGTFSVLIVLVSFLSSSGTIYLAGSAYANTHAMLIFLLAVWSTDLPIPNLGKWLLCGVLSGIAAATRTEFVLGVATLVVWQLFPLDGWTKRILRTFVIGMVSIFTMVFCIALLNALSPQPYDKAGLAWSTGISVPVFNYPAILNKWVLSSNNFIIPMGVLSSLVVLIFYRKGDAGKKSPWIILVITGWLIWFAWLLRAPFAHLRYLWPSIALFAIVIGNGLAQLYTCGVRSENKFLKILALVLILGYAIPGIGSGFRMLVVGDSNILTAETSGYGGLDYFRRFQHVQDQWASVAYIKETFSDEAPIGIIGADRELNYLSGKNLSLVLETSIANDNTEPERILVPPGTYYRLSRSGRLWIEENCELEVQFGRYSFYRVVGSYPEGPFKFVRGAYNLEITKPLSSDSAGTLSDF